MALTGLQHETNAMYHLGKLKAGGVPSTDQQAAFLPLLNEVLEGLQLAGALGVAATETLTGKSDTTGISTAGVVTRTVIGGTSTLTTTPVVVSTYATTGTTNTYPVGWDEALDYMFAVVIAGAQGATIPDHVQAGATAGRELILSAVSKGASAPA